MVAASAGAGSAERIEQVAWWSIRWLSATTVTTILGPPVHVLIRVGDRERLSTRIDASASAVLQYRTRDHHERQSPRTDALTLTIVPCCPGA